MTQSAKRLEEIALKKIYDLLDCQRVRRAAHRRNSLSGESWGSINQRIARGLEAKP